MRTGVSDTAGAIVPKG